MQVFAIRSRNKTAQAKFVYRLLNRSYHENTQLKGGELFKVKIQVTFIHIITQIYADKQLNAGNQCGPV